MTMETTIDRKAAEAARAEAQKARARENGAKAFRHWVENAGSPRMARMVATSTIPIPDQASDSPPAPQGLGIAMNVEHGRKFWESGFLAACREYVVGLDQASAAA